MNIYKNIYKFLVSFILSLIILLLFPLIAHAQEKSAGSSAILYKPETTSTLFDKRVKILREFLKTYNSPLAENSETFVKTADTYKLDYRFVAAISGVESSFAKELPYNSYNAWGWGIYGDNMIYFSSYDEAIETISKALREKYINTWKAKDVYQIGKFYAASPTWAQRVVYFMTRIEKFENQKESSTLPISL